MSAPRPAETIGSGVNARALVAMLDTDRDVERTGRQVGHGAADVGGIIVQMLMALVVLGEPDEVQHLLRDRPRAAEQVQRHAGRGAIRDRPDCLRDAVGADVAGEALPGLVDAEGAVDVPVPVVPAHAELAVERGRRRIGVTFWRKSRWPASIRRRAMKV